MKILITGVAGFIGMHVTKKLLDRGEVVIGIDNLNDYYDVNLKKARIDVLKRYQNFKFFKIDITDYPEVNTIFVRENPKRVIHLAAQAGVRYSITNPKAYIDANLQGFIDILEACRHNLVENLVYASSSSVYGNNKVLPFSEHHNVDHPISLYAATKRANELMAHSYSHLYKLPTTGLRFFTAYGPWGRPDMALFIFTKAIVEGKYINVFNNGDMIRDFTYIDDISEGVVRAIDKLATPKSDLNNRIDPATSNAPYRIFNVGNNEPIKLMDYIRAIETELGKEAMLNYEEMQSGDVPATISDSSEFEAWTGFKPSTTMQYGVHNFVNWYLAYYKNKF